MDPATRVPDADPITEVGTRRRRRKAPIAAFLSFLFPGGGQWYNHQPWLAVAFAAPIAILLVAFAIAAVMLGDGLVRRLLDRRVVIGLLVADLVVLAWRLAAMLQAHRRRARLRPGRVGTQVTALLVVVTLIMHAAPAAYGWMLLETLNTVSFEGDQSAERGSVRDTFPGLARDDDPSAPVPSAPPAVEEGARTNILLVGIDSGVGRDHALTDTMLVVSLDPDGESAMLSIPRDLVNAPLPNGEAYPWKLNSLLQAASADPDGFPFGGGAATLKATIAALLGVPIHYFAAVDMAGFEHIVDAVGGVGLTVESPIADESAGLYLEAGPVFMDGALALLYVRSRHGTGNNDFVRAGRQQQVIAAIRNQLAETNLLTSLPGLLDAVQSTIATDVPADRISDLAAAVQGADMANLERAVIQPPGYVTPATGADGAYILLPDLALIRELGRELLGG